MRKKIVGIFVCTLLIFTIIPAAGNIKRISTSNENDLNEPSADVKTWIRTIGGKGYDIGYSVQQTSDYGYIIVGSTESYCIKGTDVWLIKTDENGDELWNKTFGTSSDAYERGTFVIQTDDNGFIIATNFWLIKTDENGNEEWHIAYSGYSVCRTDDEGFVVVGEYGGCLWILKVASNGKVIWEKNFKDIESTGYSIKQTSDHGYIIAGEHCILKTDENGEKNWIIALDSDMIGRDVLQCSDENYAAIGWKDDLTDHESGWLIRIDNDGNILSWKNYSSLFTSYNPVKFYQTSDGGYIITGEADTCFKQGPAIMSLWLAKTDEYGDLIWSKRFGYDFDFGLSVQETSDGGYVVVGGTNTYGAGSVDIWFIKTDSNGKVQRDKVRNIQSINSFELLPNLFRFLQIFNLRR